MQHVWAQMSEKLSDVVDPAVKYGRGDSVTQEILARFSKIIASFEDEESVASAAELVDGLRQLLMYAIEKWTSNPKSEGGN